MEIIKISEIQIVPVKPQGGLVAFASCVVNNQLYVGNIGIHTTPDGDFRLVYPSKILPNGKEINCVHPINKVAGEMIQVAIITSFKTLVSRKCGDDMENKDGFKTKI